MLSSPSDSASRFGKYEILARLSTGGMAEVYLAQVTGPGGFKKLVVVKRILPELRADPDFVQLFYDEANITASLSHSNIAQVYELGDEGGELFLALEYIPGADLSTLMRRLRKERVLAPLGFSCRVMRDVARALAHAHGFADEARKPRPVIHRDLSARNVMVSSAGIVKVIDFGIARVSGSVGRTLDGAVRGSSGYMSPEQALGKPLDCRTDLFSAGVVFYELLTGRRLFGNKDPLAALRDIVEGPIEAPVSLGVPSRLSDVVMRALSRDPEQRIGSARELSLAIETAYPDLYDEEAVGGFLQRHFGDQLSQVRTLVEQAEKSKSFGRAPALAIEATPAHAGAVREAPTTQLPTIGAGTILAVDDSQVLRSAVEQFLRAAGHTVITCETPELALATLVEIMPDLIILDVKMPQMNGFELCRKIRGLPGMNSLPIVFLSAACSMDERAEGLAAGADDFIRKPFEPADLVARVRSHLLAAARRTLPE